MNPANSTLPLTVRKLRRQIRFDFRQHSGGTGGGPFIHNLLPVLVAKWLILTAAVMLAAYIIEDIHVSGFLSAFFAAAAIGVLNLFFRPVLLVLTLPINIMTLGLFTFVINALMLKIASGIIPGFSVAGFWSTVFGAIVISVVSWALNSLLADARRPGSGPGPGPGRNPRRDSEHIDLERKGDRWE
ncbi:MAG: phage holin family protein [Desulfobacterales bacterium]|nr:phage holin family protein [Desulfobacterales bacterium]MBS3756730.1 phage holin family protein [Desulfobacterales bacterium]